MAKFGKSFFFEISRAKISKMKEKIEIPASTSFLKSVSMQKIMSIEQFLQELLSFKDENWTHF